MKESDLIFGLMAALNKEEFSVADFLHLLAPFQISESCLRTNLSRMGKERVIESRREGRKSFYRFADRGARTRSNVAFSFRTLDWSGWDRSWWGILFSVPDIKKAERHRIRKKLLAYRFVSWYPGFWIRPFHAAERIEQVMQSLFQSPHCQAIRFHPVREFTQAEVATLWRLEQVEAECRRGLTLLTQKRVELVSWSPEQALVEKMEVGGAVIPILFQDPLLPEEYLPADWNMEALRKSFFQWDRDVTDASKPYWEEIFEAS